MAVLTDSIALEEDVWKNVDEEAKAEETTRGELVDKAVRIYIKTKALERLRKWGQGAAAEVGINDAHDLINACDSTLDFWDNEEDEVWDNV